MHLTLDHKAPVGSSAVLPPPLPPALGFWGGKWCRVAEEWASGVFMYCSLPIWPQKYGLFLSLLDTFPPINNHTYFHVWPTQESCVIYIQLETIEYHNVKRIKQIDKLKNDLL